MGLDSFKEDIKKEADAGNSDAMNLLGVIARNENEMEKAIGYFKQAIELKEYDALNELGQTYEMIGDYKNARKCYEKAFDDYWNIDAGFNLGKMYYYGNGVKQNTKKGVAYLEECAGYGQLNAIKELIIIAEKEEGLLDKKLIDNIKYNRDVKMSDEIYEKAKLGDRRAQMQYKVIVDKLRANAPNFKLIQENLEKAKSGDVDALYFVVGCYLVGRYVKKQDENKAMQILMDIKHISKKDAKMVISELLK